MVNSVFDPALPQKTVHFVGTDLRTVEYPPKKFSSISVHALIQWGVKRLSQSMIAVKSGGWIPCPICPKVSFQFFNLGHSGRANIFSLRSSQ